jgi:two-component system, OmpR family, sensor kinase
MKPSPLRPHRPAAIFVYLPAGIPILLGLAADLLLHAFLPGVPILILRADLGIALFLAGCLATVVYAAAILTRQRRENHFRRALVDTQKAQDETRRRFYRRLDHEIKNPLTAMRAALANFPESTSSSEQLRVFQDVQHQVDRLSRLVSDLRKLAELEERPLEKLPVDLANLLEEVAETARTHPVYSGRNIQLVLPRVPWPLSPIIGDPDLLGLAFYNLVDNALKFTGPENPIEIRAFEDGRSLLVEVADTGPGIPPDDLPRIFEELYRGTNARGFEGSGLGLALVQRVITRHGGTVSVRSRPGQGSVFTVRLPV